MSEFTDVHIGKQLQVAYSPAGVVPIPPPCYSTGAAAVPGTGYFNGGVLVGSPLAFPIPNIPDATLMVARANPAQNPLASAAPSIFKVTTKFGIPATPIDVMLGDPAIGMVGITVNSQIISIINASTIKIVTPNLSVAGTKTLVGASQEAGVLSETGVQAQAGAEARSGSKADNGKRTINGALVVNGSLHVNGRASWTSSIVGITKKFDIPHPTKEGHRLEHGCLEGPELGVYVRGRLKENTVIELPYYWKDLVHEDSITVDLTPIGCHQHLYVDTISSSEITIKNNTTGGRIDCFYHVYGERKDVDKLLVEYEGTEPRGSEE